MGKIVYLMGKSSTGKDTIYQRILQNNIFGLKRFVPYTTRPIRSNEKNGVEYFFTDEEGFKRLKEENRIIEDRAYDTFHGLWRYFTVNDEQLDLENNNYIYIGTLESYVNTKKYFGEEKVLPVLIELDDGIRLERALNREKKQENPKYEEMCRRFLADSADFSEEKVKEAGIEKRFYNQDLEECLREIQEYLKAKL
ncbi:MAG: guanylate kinase [Lachnospiraceae bacterium]